MRYALRVMRSMPDFHSKKIESCFKELKTSIGGLAREEAEKRIKKYGPNKLAEEKPLRKMAILISQLKSPLIYILLIAGFITLILQDYIDAGVIFASVIINTVIGFFQENKANNALSKLKKMVEHKALVLREGREIEIDSGNITIGDIIIIRAGNRIPPAATAEEFFRLLFCLPSPLFCLFPCFCRQRKPLPCHIRLPR